MSPSVAQSANGSAAALMAAVPAGDAIAAALGGRFRLPAAEVAQLRQQHSMTHAELLQSLIAPAAALARPPISSFHVGAVALGDSGDVYIGVNLEFPGTPLNNSVHAEQFLLSNAAWNGETGLQLLAVSAAPCGHCRQFYSELACAEVIRISFGSPVAVYSLPELLPQRFGPADLLDITSTPLLLQPQDNRVVLAEPLDSGFAAANPVICAAAEAAVRAANKSYAPYSHCPSGAALVTPQQGVHDGMYLESVAFNPSLSPLQSAFATAVRAGLESYDQVRHVVLVELPGAAVQHAENAALLLSKIAPKALLTVFALRRDAQRPL